MNRFLFFLFLLLSQGAAAQTTNVTFKITNTNGEPVVFATVVAVPVADSAAAQTSLSDSAGTVRFNLSNQLYTLRISSIEYSPLEKDIAIKPGANEFRLVLQPVSKALNSVVVTARKPLMRQEDDKTIVDPEPLANASTNAYEIMEKIPGLFVDQDGNIYLSSTSPARVYINGREQRMSAADIATILKSLPPNAIASIEILRTPSARYDASGGGGVVNVILRKGVRIGLTGSVNTGMNQGRYGNQFLGFNLNNSSGKVSSYLNVQANRRNNFEDLTTQRLFAQDTALRQEAVTRFPATSYYWGYGINYALSDQWELSYDGRLSYNNSRTNSTNESVIRKISTGQAITNSIATINNKQQNISVNQGVNVKYRIDSAGSEWTTDLSFTYSPNNTNQFFTTTYQLPVRTSTIGDARIENGLSFYSAASNYLRKLGGSITLETGVKATGTRFENSNDYYREKDGSRTLDPVRTGAYTYNENINAGYVQGSKSIGALVIKAGVRLENTNMNGQQRVPRDTSFSLNRTDLFPYVYISRNLMAIAGYDLKAYLVYRRTIVRPAYENLNPSPRYVDPYLFETGNPSLRPQFNQNYEANISIDERPIFAVGVNETKDIFNQVVYQADSNRSQAYRTYVNLGKNKETYFRALGAIPPGRTYFFVAGLQYNYNHYEGLYENQPLGFRRGSWRFFTYHNLRLGSNTQLSMFGFLIKNGQLQFYELSDFGQLNTNLSQQFLNKKLTLTLSVQDIFYTNKNEFVLNQGTLNATGMRQGDTRRFGLNLRYNFGIRKRDEQKLPDLLNSGGQQ